MHILTIDTALQGCAVGLYNSEKDDISEDIINMERGQAEHLVPMIQDLVQNFETIDLIAVTKGPGAFAGLRIGLMSAKTFGMVLNKPVVGISTFDAISHTVQGRADIILLETKRHDYYAKIKDAPPECLTAQDVIEKSGKGKITIAGNANDRFKSEVTAPHDFEFIECNMVAPQSLAKLALWEFTNNPGGLNTDPIYLRGPEIGQPKTPPRRLKTEISS